jgi:hypothetical protein
MLPVLGNPRYSLLTVLTLYSMLLALGNPRYIFFSSAYPCTQCSRPWATPSTSLQQCFPLYTMFLALGNARYNFLTVLTPVHNAPGGGQPQVHLFNSAPPCTQCSWRWATQVLLFNSASACSQCSWALTTPGTAF